MVHRFSQEIDYYMSFQNGMEVFKSDIQQSVTFIRYLSQLAGQYNQTDYAKEIEDIFQEKVNKL